jgi:hypothetical protein
MIEYLKANPLLVGALITAVAGGVLAILNFLFNRWNDNRRRNLEKRATIHDRNIQDARDYLEEWIDVINMMKSYHMAFTGDTNRINYELERIDKNYADYPFINKKLQNMEVFDILNDAELEKLNIEFLMAMSPRMDILIEMLNMLQFETKFDMEMVQIEELNVPIEVSNLITKMKIRLDKLASELK